jgi:glycerate dehydrogenase
MNAVFLDRASLDLGDLDLSALREVLPELQCFDRSDRSEVADRIRGAEVVILNKVKLDGPLLEQAPQLKLICVVATGTDNVAIAEARARGIVVTNVRGYGTSAVAQHTLCLMLALSIRLLDYSAAVGRGDWSRAEQFCLLDYPIQELSGRVLGIVGLGTLGRAVVELAQAFGMRVLVAQRPGGGDATPGRLPLVELLPQVDILSLHCPLTTATRNLIGEAELALMKPGALLINAARGGIVDEHALAGALRQGVIGGAGVDALSAEPPGQDNPLLQPGIPNLIVTPHCAWGSREARQRIVGQVVENINGFLDGEPRRVVD